MGAHRGDPAAEFIAEIVAMVPVSRWSFARLKEQVPFDRTLCSDARTDPRDELAELLDEVRLQRAHVPRGPRIVAPLRPISKLYASALVLMFADRRRDFGILRLMRTAEVGPFSSIETDVLAIALSAATDRLSGCSVRVQSTEAASPSPGVESSPMYVLDEDLRIVLATGSSGRTGTKGLPRLIEAAVRSSLAASAKDRSVVAQSVAFLTVTVQPLSGALGRFVGVVLQRSTDGHLFGLAASHFNFSTREMQTLGMLLQGATLGEAAHEMQITQSTVQDHVRKLLDKTGSRNRSEMISKVLAGQQTTPPFHAPW